jgi:hypothetical protein
LILEQLETRTKNSRKVQFETQIKILKSNHARGIAQHRAAYAHLTRKSNRLLERIAFDFRGSTVIYANSFDTLSVKYLVIPGDIIVTYLTAGPVCTGINEEVSAVKCEHLTCQEQQVSVTSYN